MALFLTAAGEAALYASAKTFSGPGAASTPGVSLTGTWYSGGSATTTKPQLLVEPSGTTSTGWSTSGTGIGVNAASGFAGSLIDAQVAAASKFLVTAVGVVTAQHTQAEYRVNHTDNTQYGRYVWLEAGAEKAAFTYVGTNFATPSRRNSVEFSVGTGFLSLQTDTGSGGTERWRLANTGHLLAGTDNAYDIGASGATRPRNLYLAGKLNVATGANKACGTGTLVGGTATIATTAVTASSLIFLTDTTTGANLGTLSVGTIVAGTSFVVNSSNALDTSTFNWLIIN